MKLLLTNQNYQFGGISIVGIPFLLDAQMQLVDTANRYLYYISAIRGRTASPATWRTYGDHLYELFSFFEENGLSWDSINEEHLAAWRNSMQARGLKRRTCNSRIRTTSAFYVWCQRKGLIEDVPFHQEDIYVSKPKGFLAHVDVSGGRMLTNELTLPSTRPLPRFLSLSQTREFIDALRPRRTQLIAWLMFFCGLRRKEAASLDIRVLPSPAGHNPDKAIKMTLDPSLTKTKGSKERWVQLPYHVAGWLFEYMMNERPKLAKKYKQKYGAHSTNLFLTHQGEELSLDGLDTQFQKASVITGIKCTPHMLRHTFAVHELIRMSGKPGINALKWVSDRLGHASINNTMVYIAAADLVNHEDLDGHVEEMLSLISGNAQHGH